jgi:dsDNA-specific endonuclease/ATPase MutS2
LKRTGGEDGPLEEDPPAEVALPIEDSLDLHAFEPREVGAVVASYLEAAIEAGFSEVRLIHGRGIGVQREIVRSVLSRHAGVAGFEDAPPSRGGWGATVVRLKTAGRAN